MNRIIMDAKLQPRMNWSAIVIEMEVRKCEGKTCTNKFKCGSHSGQKYCSRFCEAENTVGGLNKLQHRDWKAKAKRSGEPVTVRVPAPEGMVTIHILIKQIGIGKKAICNYGRQGIIPFHRASPRRTYYSVDEVKNALIKAGKSQYLKPFETVTRQ
jgi:hypothetical protein